MERQEDIEADIEKYEAYLRSATNKGKIRNFPSARNAERVKITNAIKRAIEAIEKELPSAADHFKRHMRTGNAFVYTGDMPWAT